MTIALESELVASHFDPLTRICSYTIQRGGERWTVKIPHADLEKHKGNKQLRRNHVANALQNAMRGAPDPHAGTKADPHKPLTAQAFAAINSGEWYVNPADGQTLQKP